MDKFNVGDKVRIVKNAIGSYDYQEHVGTITTIVNITTSGNYEVKENEHVWYPEELELVKNESPVYQFCVTYYYEVCSDGDIDPSKTRRATVFASDIKEALGKITKIDSDYQKCADLSFHEIHEGELK